MTMAQAATTSVNVLSVFKIARNKSLIIAKVSRKTQRSGRRSPRRRRRRAGEVSRWQLSPEEKPRSSRCSLERSSLCESIVPAPPALHLWLEVGAVQPVAQFREKELAVLPRGSTIVHDADRVPPDPPRFNVRLQGKLLQDDAINLPDACWSRCSSMVLNAGK